MPRWCAFVSPEAKIWPHLGLDAESVTVRTLPCPGVRSFTRSPSSIAGMPCPVTFAGCGAGCGLKRNNAAVELRHKVRVVQFAAKRGALRQPTRHAAQAFTPTCPV